MPRNVAVSDDLVNNVQGQVDMLEARGVNKIILAGHLLNITNEAALVAQLDGLEVVIAGGGEELLANPGDPLVPGDEGFVCGPYPQMASDMNGSMVPVVTTSGGYRYVGRLVMGFDKKGNVIVVDEGRSGPMRVDDAVEPDPATQPVTENDKDCHGACLATPAGPDGDTTAIPDSLRR